MICVIRALFGLGALALLAISDAALAVPIAPGETFAFFGEAGTSAATDPELAGGVLETFSDSFSRTESGFVPPDTIADLFFLEGGLLGDATESGLTGEIIFGTQLTISRAEALAEGVVGVRNYALTGYAGFEVDVDFRNDLAPGYPWAVTRSADGDSLVFNDGPGFLLMSDGAFFSIKTNATAFANTGTAEITTFVQTFGDETIVVSGLPVPATASVPVPSPSVLVLLVGGFSALGHFGRRRRR